MTKQRVNFAQLTTDIVSAYVSNNHVQPAELPALLTTVHEVLIRQAGEDSTAETTIKRPAATQIRKSVQPDGIVSFIDGRTYKTLRRHLTANGLTPATYCERYGLPADYPMVAAAYREQRSNLAKAIGLGVPGARVERVEPTKQALQRGGEKAA